MSDPEKLVKVCRQLNVLRTLTEMLDIVVMFGLFATLTIRFPEENLTYGFSKLTIGVFILFIMLSILVFQMGVWVITLSNYLEKVHGVKDAWR